MPSTVQLVFVLFGFGMSFVVAAVAERKGYNKDLWAFWGLVFWPLALPMILAKPEQHRPL